MKSEDRKLYGSLVRLAYAKPQIRKTLLPLLQEAKLSKVALGLGVGNEHEDEKSKLRFYRFTDSLRVWDLTNAGKRGKKVQSFALLGLEVRGPDQKIMVDKLVVDLLKSKNFAGALSTAEKAIKELFEFGIRLELYSSEFKGVDIKPAGFRPIKIKTDELEIEAGFDDFVVRDLADKNNLPACIPSARGGKRDVLLFYRWVSDNKTRLKSMTFREVVKALSDAGIKYHQYCSMD